MNPTEMLATYETIAAITGRMRAAAQGADWERLAALERDCAKLVATLRAAAPVYELTRAQHKRKFELLRQMLDDDAEIRRHTEPWMEQLKSMMASAGKSRRINSAYGA
jgi:flagellar protein FliT